MQSRDRAELSPTSPLGGAIRSDAWKTLPRRSVDARSSVVVASVVVASVGASVGAVVDGDA